MIDQIESTFTHFVVRNFGCWGKGKTIAEAKRNCRTAGAKMRDRMMAHWGTADIECLSDGSVTGGSSLEGAFQWSGPVPPSQAA